MVHSKRTRDNSDGESDDDNVMPIDDIDDVDDEWDYREIAKGDDRYHTYEIQSSSLTPKNLFKMRKDKFKINDRILVNPANQEGLEVWRVYKDENKGKALKKIKDYYMEYSDDEDEYEEDHDNDVDNPESKKQKRGGKKNKSKKQRKSTKRGKTRKSKKERKTRKNRK